MTRHLNITMLSHLSVMEKSMLEKTPKYLEFYIAYAKKLLDIKSKVQMMTSPILAVHKAALENTVRNPTK